MQITHLQCQEETFQGPAGAAQAWSALTVQLSMSRLQQWRQMSGEHAHLLSCAAEAVGARCCCVAPCQLHPAGFCRAFDALP